ncbi:tetratricopeptide repeat protein [Streptomyces sp. NBC_01275]|uniref:tetratricopeptide repeat protein n=1 Tax=Streptomyces sp. NBC_01275 TaxID=2903807 RepID=UPI0022508270|nr:tetratricopeptide repeat protein [Streptomyces sp. NBC_01275]MCX4765210.1 tetratricopeptide repeat protein [Streptomyces sp. NBC_01275]
MDRAPRTAPPSGGVSSLLGAPAVFTGRDEEAGRLLDVLDPGGAEGAEGAGGRVAAVAGLGGVGKTALALHVAHAARQRGWFPGGALFVDMRGYDEAPTTADHAVLSLLRTLVGVGGDEGRFGAGDDLYACYRVELASREPVLIVLDNVSDPARITPLLPGEGIGHRVLITSREAQDSLPVRQFTIGALRTEDACLLVGRKLREGDPGDRRAAEEPDAVRELAGLCGNLPLALLIAAALLRRRRHSPVASLADELRAAADRVRALRFKGGVDQYRRELALGPVFEVMYGRLEPETARVLRALGQAPTPDASLDTALALTGSAPDELRPHLDDLVACSLLTADPGGGRWRMHDLVQVYVRTVSSGDADGVREAEGARERLLRWALHAVLAATACLRPGAREGAPDDMFSGSYWGALNWLDQERQTLLGLAQWTDPAPPEQARLAMVLAMRFSPYLQLSRSHQDWLDVAQAAHRTAQRLGDRETLAATSILLGSSLYHLGRHERAVDHLRRAQQLCAELHHRSGEAAAWTILGLALHGLRRFPESTEAHARSLQLHAPNGNRNVTAFSLINYGLTLNALGRVDDAHQAVTRALDLHIGAANRAGEAGARAVRGSLLRQTGRTDDAADELLRSAQLYDELGHWHSAAERWLELGRLLRDLGRDDHAWQAFTAAAEAYDRAGADAEAAEARRLAGQP